MITETNSIFTNNAATTEAATSGAVYYGTSGATATFTSSKFDGNSASQKGGAIYLSV